MPEYRECLAHFILLLWWLKYCLNKDLDLRVVALWADAVLKAKNSSDRKHSPDGLVYQLQNTSTAKRGNRLAQTPLWPPMWKATKDNPDPPSITNLVWRGVKGTPRAVIMDFGVLVFQLAFLTHTSIQIFKISTWETQIKPTSQHDRRFRIALAFEFKDFVVAFVSNDLVVQPHWAPTMDELPPAPKDVKANYGEFLQEVASWFMDRHSRGVSSEKLACQVIRTNGNKVFGGVGVYTISEVFHTAGLSVFLTERELLYCPSRFARFLESLWVYAHTSHKIIKPLLRSCMHDGLLAPDKQQRLRYADHLRVYGKTQCLLPSRAARLVNNYNHIIEDFEKRLDVLYRDEADNLFDIFEPNYLKDALTIGKETKSFHLGCLIFGKDRCQQLGLTPTEDDPITKMYARLELLNEPTHLPEYDKLYDFSESVRNYKRLPTYTYRVGGDSKQAWTLIHAFPSSSRADRDASMDYPVKHLTGKDRIRLLFKNIVENTDSVAIGPLEYCGNATIVRDTHGRKVVSAVFRDRSNILAVSHKDQHANLKYGYFSPQKGKSRKQANMDSEAEADSDAEADSEAKADSEAEADSESDNDKQSSDPGSVSTHYSKSSTSLSLVDPSSPPPSPSSLHLVPSTSFLPASSDREASLPASSEWEGDASSDAIDLSEQDISQSATSSVPASPRRRSRKRKSTHISADRFISQTGLSLLQDSETGGIVEVVKRARPAAAYAYTRRKYTKKSVTN